MQKSFNEKTVQVALSEPFEIYINKKGAEKSAP